MLAILPGCRHPVVVILVLISFFTTISGKPLDGVLMLVAAVALAWDNSRRQKEADPGASPVGPTTPSTPPAITPPAPLAGTVPADAIPAGADAADAAPASAGPADAGLGGIVRAETAPADAAPVSAGRSRWLVTGAALAGGAAFAVVTGSFSRYSWPATIAVMAAGVAAVARGWRGPARLRPDPGPLPLAGTAAWVGVLVAGGLWELSALLQQPTLTTGSYAHPTISTLTDPLLSAAPGRTLVLAAWLALGWALVRR